MMYCIYVCGKTFNFGILFRAHIEVIRRGTVQYMQKVKYSQNYNFILYVSIHIYIHIY